MPDFDAEIPLTDDTLYLVDQWSRLIYEVSGNWPLASAGQWFRSDEGWISLSIGKSAVEPLALLYSVDLSTMDERIELSFGTWRMPIFRSAGPPEQAAEYAMAKAREMIEGWLSGEIKSASYSDETGWRGGKLILGGAFPDAIEPVPVEIGRCATVTVHTAWCRDWRSWHRTKEGAWIECESPES